MKLKGFTLLEILVALVIVTTVFMVCFLSLSEMTKNTVVLQDKTFAALLANHEIAITKLKQPTRVNSAHKQVIGNIDYVVGVEFKTTEQKNIQEIEAIIMNNQGRVILNEKGYNFVPPKQGKSVHTY